MKRTVTVAPISCHFSNENKVMGLRPHQHYAEVTLTFETLGKLGFPVFGDTVDGLAGLLRAATKRPFRDATNEDVADRLFQTFTSLVDGDAKGPEGLSAPWEAARRVLSVWGGDYRLERLQLAVRGVPDDIGHSDGFAIYDVRA